MQIQTKIEKIAWMKGAERSINLCKKKKVYFYFYRPLQSCNTFLIEDITHTQSRRTASSAVSYFINKLIGISLDSFIYKGPMQFHETSQTGFRTVVKMPHGE